MALALGTSPLVGKGTGNITSASITPAANSLVVACHVFNTLTGGTLGDTISDSTTRTWTRQVTKSSATGSNGGAGTSGGTSIWTAVANGSAMTVTAVNNDGTGTGREHMLFVYVLTDTGTPTVGVVAANFATTGTPTTGTGTTGAAMTGLTVGSYVFASASDWAAVGPSAASYTAGTGQTLGASDWVSGQYGGEIWRTTSTLAGTTQTMNEGLPAGQNWNLVAMEVKANSSGATLVKRRPGKRTF